MNIILFVLLQKIIEKKFFSEYKKKFCSFAEFVFDVGDNLNRDQKTNSKVQV